MNNKNKIPRVLIFREIWRHLSKRRRKQLIMLPILMSLTGLSEILSISSVVPFLKALSITDNEVEIINNIAIYKIINDLFKIDGLLLLILVFLLAITTAGILRLLTNFSINYITAGISSDFSRKAYDLSLKQSYRTHINRNSSGIISSIITNTDRTNVVISSFLNLATSFFIGTALVISLLKINWIITLSITIFISLLYFVLILLLKQYLNRISKNKAKLTDLQTRSLQEGLGSIRDIILDNSQKFYLNIFANSDNPLRFLVAKSDFLATSPRYVFEIIALYLVMIIAYVWDRYAGAEFSILPLLGSMVLGLQRLLPAFQVGYSSWVNISTNLDSILNLIRLLDQPDKRTKLGRNLFPFNKEINLKNVCFRYSTNKKETIKKFNLIIKKGERIGIIGPSGSGKSTIADLIMGLLRPTDGKIEIDGIDLHSKKSDIKYQLENWYRNISHVPQEIYLADSNIAENIALGIPKDKIDEKKLEYAIKASKLSDFVGGIDNAFSIKVGERGVQLSGGQKQRIGIARAIYKGGNILILDEATSALDIKTESRIMETIDNLSTDLTIIIITHRLNNLKSCQRLVELSST